MPSSTLTHLQARYGPRLDQEIESRIRGSTGQAPLAGMMLYQLGYVNEDLQPSGRSGKRSRPVLCLLSSEAGGCPWEEALGAAAGIELLHNFSLIHDDIEDGDPSRRHRPTVWKVWGEAHAINVGDAMFALAASSMLDTPRDPQLVAELARRFQDTSLALTEGQYMDMSFEDREDVTTGEYLVMIRKKTAALLGFSVMAGGLVAGMAEPALRSLCSFGIELGLAFQIHDDVMGLWGSQELTGKQESKDLHNRKKTLPLLFALEGSTIKQQGMILSFLRREIDDDRVVFEVLDSTGVREKCEREVASHLESAFIHLRRSNIRGEQLTLFERLSEELTARGRQPVGE